MRPNPLNDRDIDGNTVNLNLYEILFGIERSWDDTQRDNSIADERAIEER